MGSLEVEMGVIKEEEDVVPSSAVWSPRPSGDLHRGLTVEESPMDFSIFSRVSQEALTIHQHSLVTVLYNIMKSQNLLDLRTIVDNNIESLVVNFQREGTRWTFLMQAAYWDNDDVIRWLFTHNADPYVRNASNQSAFDIAMKERNIQAAETIRIRMAELTEARRLASTGRSSPRDIPKKLPVKH